MMMLNLKSTISVYLVLGLAGCSLAGYDWSSPNASLLSLQRAFAQIDAEGVRQGMFYSSGNTMAGSPLALGMEGVGIGSLLKQLTIGHVDKKVLFVLSRESSKPAPRYDDAVRVVCSFRDDEGRYPRNEKHRWALYFVKKDDQWKWYVDPYRLFEEWSYDTTSPEKAYNSVRLGIGKEDVSGIYELIDPELSDNIERSIFLSTAVDRFASARHWETQRLTTRAAATKRSSREREERTPPYKSIEVKGARKTEVELLLKDGRQDAQIWILGQNGSRKHHEEFVKTDQGWRWRPRAEYTMWPLSVGSAPLGSRPN